MNLDNKLKNARVQTRPWDYVWNNKQYQAHLSGGKNNQVFIMISVLTEKHLFLTCQKYIVYFLQIFFIAKVVFC